MAVAPHGVRKLATVVFCDVVGSTALGERLDPEALQALLGRYFAVMRAVLERHGGTVEKFIGDAVVAVFGAPAAHDDDALRAVRAALAMRAALAGLNAELERESGVGIEIRIGVNSGEVLVGDLEAGASFASGDAVNVAARLEQAAAAGEVLIGPLTHRLVEHAVKAEPVEGLSLKGKAEPVAAWRLLELVPAAEALERHWETPFVGRRQELATLQQEYERAVEQHSCRLVSVIGEPGVGKTRLVREFVAALEPEAQVLTGFCVPYGEGITYWPLAEIIRWLAGPEPLARLTELASAGEAPEIVARLVAGAVGAVPGTGRTDEIQWAVRRLFEALARERPLVVVFEDLHWAEPALLDLVEYLADTSSSAPILLIAVARDDLLADRPAWTLPRANATPLMLEPLEDDDVRGLLADLGEAGDDEEEAALARACGGNPLFLEQLVAARSETTGPGAPATIQALLAARVDSLSSGARAAAERAAVEGATFHRGLVAELLPPAARDEVGAALLELSRRRLIRPHHSDLEGDEGYRFSHMLVRDSVYRAIPKQLRAELHERLAERLEATMPAARTDEVVGYHLEQASRCHAELGAADAASSLGRRAAEHLAVPARIARSRWDCRAACALYERAIALLPERDPLRLRLLTEVAHELQQLGELDRAHEALREAEAGARELGDEALQAHAAVVRSAVRYLTDPAYSAEDALVEADALIAVLARTGYDDAELQARGLHASLLTALGQSAAADAEFRSLSERARRTGNAEWVGSALSASARTQAGGPTPVPEALASVERAAATAEAGAGVGELALTGLLLAISGEFARARDDCDRSTCLAEEFGDPYKRAASLTYRGEVELLAGDAAAAEQRLRTATDLLAEAGETAWRASALAHLAEALYRQNRYDEAEAVLQTAAELAQPSDLDAHILLNATAAKLHAHRGEHDQAEQHARTAVELADRTDWLAHQADARLALADVLTLQQREDEAQAALKQARELYLQKGHTVGAQRTSDLLHRFANRPPSRSTRS